MIRKRLTLDDSTTEETMDREPCTIIPGELTISIEAVTITQMND